MYIKETFNLYKNSEMDKKYEYLSRKTKPPLPHTLCLGTCHASLRSEGRRHLIVLSFLFLFQVLKKTYYSFNRCGSFTRTAPTR